MQWPPPPHTAMLLLLLAPVLSAAASAPRGPDQANCLPGTWLPRGTEVQMCSNPGQDYDGSLVPDCAAFQGPQYNTSFFHVHEYGGLQSPDSYSSFHAFL